MQAIRTRYPGPTDARVARISAQCEAGKIIVPYDHALNLHENHTAAAAELQQKLGWTLDEYYPPVFGGAFGSDHFWVFSFPGNSTGV